MCKKRQKKSEKTLKKKPNTQAANESTFLVDLPPKNRALLKEGACQRNVDEAQHRDVQETRNNKLASKSRLLYIR